MRTRVADKTKQSGPEYSSSWRRGASQGSRRGARGNKQGGKGGGEPVKPVKAQEGGPGGTSRREMEEKNQSRLKEADQGEQTGWKWRRGTSQGSRRGEWEQAGGK